MKKIVPVLALIFVFTNSFSQKWIEMMQQPGKNFYEIQKEFNNYWIGKDISEPGNGYKPFKR